MDDEPKGRVVELAKKLAAEAGRELEPYQLRDVWRDSRKPILDESWLMESAVSYEVNRRLHVTSPEPW